MRPFGVLWCSVHAGRHAGWHGGNGCQRCTKRTEDRTRLPEHQASYRHRRMGLPQLSQTGDPGRHGHRSQHPKVRAEGRTYQCTSERAGYSKPKRVRICELNAPRLLQRQDFLVEWLSCLGVRWCLGCSLRCTKSSSSHEPLPRSMDLTCHG